MTDLDDLDLMDAQTPATPNVTTKRCRRHDWSEMVDMDRLLFSATHSQDWKFTACRRCGKVKDPAVSRRSRNNKNRGLAIQRKRIEALGGTNLAGNNENLDGIGLAFAYESKSGGAFSERVWRWLSGIPTKGNQTGVLIVTETPGPGRKARSYVVVSFDEWRALHGETREEAS